MGVIMVSVLKIGRELAQLTTHFSLNPHSPLHHLVQLLFANLPKPNPLPDRLSKGHDKIPLQNHLP